MIEESPVITWLGSLISQGPTTFEITILPFAVEETTSSKDDRHPSLEQSLVLMDGHLGLDGRSVPWMTREIRKSYKHLKTKSSCDEDPTEYATHMMRVTSCLLLVNPDHATAWADRRRSLQVLSRSSETQADGGWWDQERTFLNLLMTQHSKA